MTQRVGVLLRAPTAPLWWALTATCVALAVVVAVYENHHRNRHDDKIMRAGGSAVIAMAFLGNSMQYKNDCPRLVQQMVVQQAAAVLILTSRITTTLVLQDSCLRGGASLPGLWRNGNGMAEKFATPPAAVGSDYANSNNERP